MFRSAEAVPILLALDLISTTCALREHRTYSFSKTQLVAFFLHQLLQTIDQTYCLLQLSLVLVNSADTDAVVFDAFW